MKLLTFLGETAMTAAIATPISQIELAPGSAIQMPSVLLERVKSLICN